MMLASRQLPSMFAGFMRNDVLSISTRLRLHFSTQPAKVANQSWNWGPDISAVVSNQRSSIKSADGRSKTSPHRSS
jgi:hypothetical protein